MDKSDEVLSTLVECFTGLDDYECRSHLDFSEKRPAPIMVIVALDNFQQVNVGLDDYKMHFNVLIDSLISDDLNGEGFTAAVKAVCKKAEEISDRDYDLTNTFKDLPVVACFYTGANRNLTQDSNRCIVGIDVITSE